MAGGAGLAAVCGLALTLASHATPTGPHVVRPGASSASRAFAHENEALGVQQGATSARQFLAQYHGARWAELEPVMSAAGLDLDVPYEAWPWEDIAPEFEQAFQFPPSQLENMISRSLDWPAALDREWLCENYRVARERRLDVEDLEALACVVAPINDELQAKAESWADQIDFLVRSGFRNGHYLRAPFTTLGLSQGLGFYSKSVAGYGWAATMTLERADHPAMAALENELSGLRRKRELAVAEWLRAAAIR